MTSQAKPRVDWLAWIGYIAAALVPILGVVIAVPIVVRGDWRNFAGVLTVAAVSFFIRIAALQTGGYSQ